MQVVDDPLQAPLQFAKDDPVLGVAVSVKTVPLTNDPEHVPGQEMAAGLDVTLPLPPFDEAIVTESVGFAAADAGMAARVPATRVASTKRAAKPVRRSMGGGVYARGAPRGSPSLTDHTGRTAPVSSRSR